MAQVVIIGAGLAGLAAATRLKRERLTYLIFEKEKRIGGLCRTEQKNGFLFDYTGHLLHFRNDIFKSLIFSFKEPVLESKKRNAWIFSQGIFTRYPFQANLYGLPADVVIDCIYEFSRRHFNPYTGPVSNFNQWVDVYFGSGIARHFLIPYNAKLYRRDLSELTPDCAGRFIPDSDLKLLLRGALCDNEENLGYNSSFYYPSKGGIMAVVENIAEGISVNTGEKVIKINTNNKKLFTSNGREVNYSRIISTQPVNELIESCEDEIDRIRDCARNLQYISVFNINLGITGNITDKHWIYVPEEKFIFHRIGFNHNFSSSMAPEGFSSIYIEISYDPSKGIDKKRAIEESIDNLLVMNIINSSEQVVLVHTIDIPYAYVVFDHKRKECLQAVRDYLWGKDIYTAGRFGSWEYFSMEDAFMDGWKVAEERVINNRN
jgi:protoporphyrinogen oxidase